MNPDLFMSYWPAWIALLVSGLIAFNRLIDESRKFAEHFGDWGKKRHDRAAKRHQIDLQATAFADAIQAAVAEAREQWETQENQAIAALDSRLAAVARVTEGQDRELANVREQLTVQAEYAEYESAWHGAVRRLASQHNGGDCIPVDRIPAHLTWWAFEALSKRNGGGRAWWGLEL